MNQNKEEQTIQNSIDNLNPWFYEVEIDGIKTVPGIGSDWDADRLKQRQIYRKKLLVDEVCKRYTFEGKNIIDLGCNCGYWGSEYIKLGAVHYQGIDGRERAVDQGKLYWSLNTFAKHKYDCDFAVMDINKMMGFSALANKCYHFALCAGLLYHVKDYKYVLTAINYLATEVVVIDTRVEDVENEVREPADLSFNGLPTALTKTVPTIYGIRKHMESMGWSVELLPIPNIDTPKGLVGKDDYRKGNRVTLYCSK